MSNVLLVDGNNLFYRSFFSKEVYAQSKDPNYELWKYITFNSIVKLIKKDVSEVVLAFDGPNNWRKIIHPNYKFKRAKTREKSEIDWERFFSIYHRYINEIADYMPFKVILQSRCEADDVIAVLAYELTSKDRKVTICSSDEDFHQLLNHKNLEIYSFKKYDIIKEEDVIPNFLEVRILNGQSKDCIYNVITPLDWPEGKRKPAFGENKAKKIIDSGLEEWLKNSDLKVRKRFKENSILIDFRNIPNSIKKIILKEYYSYVMPKPESHLCFFEKYNWKRYQDDLHHIDLKLSKLY
ncbi:MAG: hypothetical protein ACOC56_02175 [Atribacterota bacterium]